MKRMAEMNALNIPVGVSDFEKIRNGDFYYIDKSGLISQILDEKAEVTLITRPRRRCANAVFWNSVAFLLSSR